MKRDLLGIFHTGTQAVYYPDLGKKPTEKNFYNENDRVGRLWKLFRYQETSECEKRIEKNLCDYKA